MIELENQEIAKIFYKIADLLEIQNVQWKPGAYRAAASAIESMPKPVEEIYRTGGLKALDEIPAVGKHISKKIEELVKTGKLRYFEKLKKDSPAIPKPPKKKDRISFAKALPIANKIVAGLKKIPSVERVEVAGSFRRKRPTIGDLDILVSSKNPAIVAKAIVSMPNVKKVLASGEKKTSIVLQNGLQVDFRVVSKGQWGSALQYFTGSKSHSIALRKIAMKKGLKLNEYGVFKGNKAIASKTEKGVYNALGMDYLKPELRENKGEIEKAIKSFNAKKK